MSRSSILCSILVVSALVRFALFFIVAQSELSEAFIFSDGKGYVQISENLLAGRGFSLSTTSPYLPDSIRTPIVPATIAGVTAITGTPLAYIVLQIACAMALVYLTYRIALLITMSERLALTAAGLMAFEPYAVFISLSILTESLFTLLITAGAYYALTFVRKPTLVAIIVASALFSLAALTRPIAQFSPALLLIIVFLTAKVREYPKYIIAVIIPFILVASPWMIRNYQTFGIAGFSSGGFQNAYSDLGGSIIAYRDGISWREAKNKLEADFISRHHIQPAEIQQNMALSPVLFREAIGIILHNPVPAAQSFTALCIGFFTNDAWTFYLQHWGWVGQFTIGFSPTKVLLSQGPIAAVQQTLAEAGSAIVIPIVGRIFWIVMSALTICGIGVLFFKRGVYRMYALFIALSILYYLALTWSVADGVNGRFRYPLDPLFFTAACVGGAYLIERFLGMMRRIRT